MKLYKLTDENWLTRAGKDNETKWGPGVSHTVRGSGGLCTDGMIHAYLTPELALFLNSIHADIKNPVLWKSEGDIAECDGQLKVGVKTLTTIQIVESVTPTVNQHVAFGILCAKAVYFDKEFNAWADAWLSGADRSVELANRARVAARAVAAAAAEETRGRVAAAVAAEETRGRVAAAVAAAAARAAAATAWAVAAEETRARARARARGAARAVAAEETRARAEAAAAAAAAEETRARAEAAAAAVAAEAAWVAAIDLIQIASKAMEY